MKFGKSMLISDPLHFVPVIAIYSFFFLLFSKMSLTRNFAIEDCFYDTLFSGFYELSCIICFLSFSTENLWFWGHIFWKRVCDKLCSWGDLTIKLLKKYFCVFVMAIFTIVKICFSFHVFQKWRWRKESVVKSSLNNRKRRREWETKTRQKRKIRKIIVKRKKNFPIILRTLLLQT